MLIAILAGVALGSLYAMVAFVYNVMYSTSKVLSLGTGQFAMAGGILGAWFLGSLAVPLWATLLLVAAGGAAFGWLTELIAVRRTMRGGGDEHLWVLSTLALSTIVQQAMGLWWGTEPTPFPRLFPQDYAGPLDQKYWLPIAFAFASALAVEWFYRRTLHGKIFVALSDDALAVQALGIPARMRALSYAIAGGLGALAGFAAGQLTYAYFALGLTLTLNGFIALAIGGIGSNFGSLLGGLLLGLMTSLTAYLFGSEFQQTIAIGTLILFLIARPAGLFGAQRVRQV